MNAPSAEAAIRNIASSRSGPLSGTIVLELCGDEPSGTFGTQILADLGATVIKLERFAHHAQDEMDDAENEIVPADVAYFWGLNRNKLSMACDLKKPEGRKILHQLAALADVVYDNHKVGVTDRIGADAATLKEINPRLVCCSVTGFGHSGPMSRSPAYDVTIQALGGGMSMTGSSDPAQPPVRSGNPIGGIMGALYAVIGILAALRQRRTTGKGDRLDLSLLDVQLALHAYRVPAALASSTLFGPERNRGGSGALPYGPFRTSDGSWFAVGITSQFWPAFCDLVGRPEWKTRFATEAIRQENEAVLNPAVTEALGSKTSTQWQELFVKAGIPGAKVADIKSAYDHPHVALRSMLVDFPNHPVGKKLKVAGDPIKFSAHPDTPLSAAPGLGEHTRMMLSEVLGLSAETISDLRDKGAIWWPEKGLSYKRQSVV